MIRMINFSFKFYWYNLIFFAIWSVLVFVIFCSSISKEDSTIFLDKKKTAIIKYFFPQGWSFFTKEPTEEMFDLYTVDDNNRINLVIQKHTSLNNFLGLSRRVRARGRELSILLSYANLNDEDWTNGFGQVVLKKELSNQVELDIPKKEDKIKYLPSGRYFIVRYGFIPPEWLNKNQNKYLPWKGVLLYLK